MSTHMRGFQLFFRIFALLCIGKFSHRQHKGSDKKSVLGYLTLSMAKNIVFSIITSYVFRYWIILDVTDLVPYHNVIIFEEDMFPQGT